MSSRNITVLALLIMFGINQMSLAKKFIAPGNPNIHYSGRWDKSDSAEYKHSWPGTYFYAEFSGTSIGVRISDSKNYYNVFIDGKFHSVFKGTQQGVYDYTLTNNLNEGKHTLRFSKRNIMFGEVFSFYGLLIDDNAEILPSDMNYKHRIEFIGDSFTAAESNEATVQQLDWTDRFPVTNIDKGFVGVISNYFNAEYTATCRSGSGILCNWEGNFNETIPAKFDRTLMESNEPKWNFKSWIPELVIICLGLNDYSGLREKDGTVSDINSKKFRDAYKSFIEKLMEIYPDSWILAVAPHVEWIRSNVRIIVDEQIKNGNDKIHYSHFSEYPDGYVAYGHPTTGTHKKIADEIIEAVNRYRLLPE
jgi:hypothetical protein